MATRDLLWTERRPRYNPPCCPSTSAPAPPPACRRPALLQLRARADRTGAASRDSVASRQGVRRSPAVAATPAVAQPPAASTLVARGTWCRVRSSLQRTAVRCSHRGRELGRSGALRPGASSAAEGADGEGAVAASAPSQEASPGGSTARSPPSHGGERTPPGDPPPTRPLSRTTSDREQQQGQPQPPRQPAAGAPVGRRGVLAAAAVAAAAVSLPALHSHGAGASAGAPAAPGEPAAAAGAAAPGRTPAQCRGALAPFLLRPDYSAAGPLRVGRLPRRPHTCAACFPACVGGGCTLRLEVLYPRGGADLGLGPPFPLAVFSAGFLLPAESYRSYAERLASWGYTVLLYDRAETLLSLLDDAACVRLLGGLLDWAAEDPLMRRLADPGRGVYMVGHSRGGKLAALAGAADPRVTALCLLDPVDNTVYAPLAPGFPSALAALHSLPRERPLPLAVVGGGLGGDCAPRQANYRRFFGAAPGPAWEVAVQEAGHFQFLDSLSGLQRAFCPTGPAPEAAVRRVAQAVMVAWGEAIVRHKGADIFQLPLPYPAACRGPDLPYTPTPQQLAQVAQLQRRRGLRGQASLAQAAYAAAWVEQQQQQQAQPQRQAAVTGDFANGGEGCRELGQCAGQADGAGVRGSAGGRDASKSGCSSVEEDSLVLEKEGSAVGEGGRAGTVPMQPHAPPPVHQLGTAHVRSSPAGHVPVAQEALQAGLDRFVKRLQYESGLSLETRYKNFGVDWAVGVERERR